MLKKIAVFGLLSTVLLASSCKSSSNKEKIIEFDSLSLNAKTIPLNPLDTIGEGLPIFYNMYLSVELSTLFETAEAVYSPELMNNVDKVSEYLTSSQQAVNLGIYAVNLSYARVFDQVEVAARYFGAMKVLSQELGIPADYFESTVKRFERNFTNKDSLIYLANEVYTSTEKYLKENERYTTAALIIMGGWIEAIYIALDVAVESEDPNIIERLIDQKYSLNNLMIMLSEHRSNEVVAEYLSKMESIKQDFNKIDVVFDADFDQNSESGQQVISTAMEQMKVLQNNVIALRKDLTN